MRPSTTTSSLSHSSWLLVVAALFLAYVLAMVSAEPISMSGLAPSTTNSETATPAPVEPDHVLANERSVKGEEAAAVEDMPDFNLRDDEALERMRDELEAREQRLRMMELAAEPESPGTPPAEGPASARGPDFQTHGPWGRRWGWGFGYPGFGFGWGWGYPGFGWGYPGFGWGGWW